MVGGPREGNGGPEIAFLELLGGAFSFFHTCVFIEGIGKGLARLVFS